LITDTGITSLRKRVRAWIAENSPPDWRRQLADATDQERARFDRALLRKLNEAGLAAPHWPVAFGGSELPMEHQLAIHDEFIRADAAWPATFFCSLNHAAHVLIHFGTPQQQQHLTRILSGDEIWCQAFSEPDAGSDLGALRTKATRRGDSYVLEGQKVWSSRGSVADRAIVLARTTSASPSGRGISMFAVDLHAPGIDVRPIRQATGESEFAEIFFNQTEVASSDLIGEEGGGWTIVREMLAAERGPGMLRFALSLEMALDALLRRAGSLGLLESPPPHLADVPHLLGTLVTEVEILRQLIGHMLDSYVQTGEIAPESLALKVLFSELHARLTEAAVRIEALPGQLAVEPASTFPATDSSWLTERLRTYRYLIGAGTNEVQRNHISERLLGLPRETRPEGF
jgi:alkylation response protein AidB-like acyl-CoA dehydrogenase